MARYAYQGVAVDGMGRRIPAATISVYKAGTTTAASIYSSTSADETAVNSVTSATDDGVFLFYVDNNDYVSSQKFDIVTSKTNYTGATYEDVQIYPPPIMLVRDISDNATSATTEADLKTATIDAHIMGKYSGLRVFAAGYMSGGSGNKTIKFDINGTDETFYPANTNDEDWYGEAVIYNNGSASSQEVMVKGFRGGSTPAITYIGQNGFNITTTAEWNIKVQAQAVDGTDQVACSMFTIELLP